MILLLDHRNTGRRVGLIGAKSFRFVHETALRRATKPSVVAVTTFSGGGVRQASWSMMRSAVALANGLSFAWGVPVVEVQVQGDEDDVALASAARLAAAGAKAGRWAYPAYGGEPNITQPKQP